MVVPKHLLIDEWAYTEHLYTCMQAPRMHINLTAGTLVAAAYSRAPTAFGVSGPACASLMTSTTACRTFAFLADVLCMRMHGIC